MLRKKKAAKLKKWKNNNDTVLKDEVNIEQFRRRISVNKTDQQKPEDFERQREMRKRQRQIKEKSRQ